MSMPIHSFVPTAFFPGINMRSRLLNRWMRNRMGPIEKLVIVLEDDHRNGPQETDKHQRCFAKWDDGTHRIFVNCCELLIAQGYRQGKCFTKTGWQQLVSMFNHEAGKDWKCSQLKNHWFNMRRDYLLLHEILRSTGIEYDHQNNTIVADDWWWERKIQWRKEEMFLWRHERKKKLGSHSALSDSIEKLATVGNKLIASHLKANSGAPSLVECMEELESFGILEGDEKFHLFALTFFEQKRHRTSYAAARTQQMKMKFLKFNFKSWCLQNAGAFDD
ncbi:Myb DNA-bind 3 domain-containing protein [Abeliophyllum distichum]|uniref:Myb DNA-bind 3 domain-containing protein n=1 Tax=Abeliophyllum distichum TaxID=126358 RepID=A0ABD1TIC7_9LAMI